MSYELQIHDESGPDLSFDFDTEAEAQAFLDREYPPRRGLDWVLLAPDGRVVDGTR